MRKLIASTFASLDGIMQAPGGPEEDPTGGFSHGGWTFHYWDETTDISGSGFDGKDRELVLGRRTYQIFEAYWPYQPVDDPIAKTLNSAKKHVASRTLKKLDWNNSSLLDGDVVSAIARLKAQPGPDLQMIGSGKLIQTLQAASLIDEYNVWTFPVVLGRGKRLFGETARPSALRLVGSQISKSGVVMSTYAPAGGVKPGSFVGADASERSWRDAKTWRTARGDMSVKPIPDGFHTITPYLLTRGAFAVDRVHRRRIRGRVTRSREAAGWRNHACDDASGRFDAHVGRLHSAV